MSKLSDDLYKIIVKNTPLITMDLIIVYQNKILLGKRINEPAKNYWFVPGGRILKDEKLEKACLRLTKIELGFEIQLNKFMFHMISEHHYRNNLFNDEFSTHCICISYIHELTNEEYKNINITDQHDDISWLSKDEIILRNDVHENVKKYFSK